MFYASSSVRQVKNPCIIKDMKKIFKLCSIFFLLLGCVTPILADEETTEETPPETTEEAQPSLLTGTYILVDNNSGSVLYEANSEASVSFSSLPYVLTVAGLQEDNGIAQGNENARWASDTQLGITDLRWHLFFTQEDGAYQVLAQKGLDLANVAASYEMKNTDVATATSTARNVASLARKFSTENGMRDLYARSVYTPTSFVDNSDTWRDALDLEGQIGYYVQNDGRVGFATFEANGAKFSAVVMEEENVDNCRNDLRYLVEYAKTHYKGLTIAKSSVAEKVLEIEEETQKATITFTLNSDISMLLGIDVDESTLQNEVVVENEKSIQDSYGYLLITRNGNEIGRISMLKKMEVEEKESVQIPYFDFFCLGLAGIAIVWFILKHGMDIMRPVE